MQRATVRGIVHSFMGFGVAAAAISPGPATDQAAALNAAASIDQCPKREAAHGQGLGHGQWQGQGQERRQRHEMQDILKRARCPRC